MSEFEEDNFISHRQPPVDVGGDEEDEDLVTSQVESSHDFDILDNEPLVDSTQNDGDLNHPAGPDGYDYSEAPSLPPAAAPGGLYDPTVADIKEEVEPEPETPVHREPSPSPEEPSETADTTCSVSRCAVVAFLAKIYFHEKVQHVLLWRNIGLTVGVLVLFLYTAFSIALLSFLSVVGYYGLAIIVCTFAIRLYRDILAAIGKQQASNFFILEMVDHAAEADWSVSKDCAMAAVGKACDAANAVANDLRDVIVVRSYAKTIKAVIALYFLTWIGSIFNLLTLIILVVLNLFYIPLLLVKFDLLNNKEINAFVMKIHGHIQQGIDVVRQKAPFLANFLESKKKTA